MASNGCELHCYSCNECGQDYVVGDIHGCFKLLEALLTHVGFDRRRDRLFSVGDLTDRGPESEHVCEWLAQPWFHAIRGNHEAMLLDATVVDGGRVATGPDAPLWQANGGDWFFELAPEHQRAVRTAVAALGLGIEVALPDGGCAAVVHADLLDDSWPATRAFLSGADCARDVHSAAAQLVWSRARAEAVMKAGARKTPGDRSFDVVGADVICFGHTPMRMPVAAGNTRWLDTGAVFGGSLSVAELAVDGQVWAMPANGDAPVTGWYRAV